jgi:hypothetical protein
MYGPCIQSKLFQNQLWSCVPQKLYRTIRIQRVQTIFVHALVVSDVPFDTIEQNGDTNTYDDVQKLEKIHQHIS